MPRIYLPTQYNIKVKDEISNQEQVVVIPGAEHMDKSQLQEIIHWQTETTKKQLRERAMKPKPRYSRKEVGAALKDYRAFLQRMREGTGNPRYY